MTRSELHRIHLRFLALPLLVVVCGILAAARIRAVGATYSYELGDYAGMDLTASNLSVDPPSMARVVDVREGPNGAPVATIEGLEPGEGFLAVMLDDQGSMSQLRVEPGPVVVADGADFSGWELLPASVSLVFAMAAVLCLWALLDLGRKAWYGYEMAAYAGALLFCVVESGVFGWLLLADRLDSFSDFALAVTSLADRFVQLTLAPTAVLALFVCASNVALMRHEGARPVNALGIATSAAWALACVVLSRIDASTLASTSMVGFVAFSVLDSVVAIGVCFGLALLAGTCASALAAARHRPAHPRDYLIVLGCGLMPDGSPTPLLAGRVDAALAYARAQQDAGWPAPKFVPSGGQGPDEACAEADAMSRYLAEQGVDGGRVLAERHSTNTRENFSNSAEVIARDGGQGARVAFSTTNYHVFRSYVYAHDAGLAAEGIAAPTRLYFWPNAFLREFLGLLASRWLPIVLAYAAIAGVYLAAEYALLLSMG